MSSALQIPHACTWTSPDDQAGEVKRLIALGATEVHWSKRLPDADQVILADPEGTRIAGRGHDPLAPLRLASESSAAAR